ncbi:MAG: DinB family protein [Pseudomonadota bacterium]
MPLTDAPYLAMALNNAWANATFFRAASALNDTAFSAPRPGFFASLCRTLNHIYEVDLYYIDALAQGGKGRSVFQREDIFSVRNLAAAQAASDTVFANFCSALTPDTLRSIRETERQTGFVTERVDALILHLVQHQIHHRGQAHVQLQDAGIDTPQLDDFYLEFGRVPSAQEYWT